MFTKCLGCKNLELFSGPLQKVFGGPCNIQTLRATGKKTHYRRLWHHRRMDGILSRHRGKEQGIKHVRMVIGNPATSVRKANLAVKVVILECCEKTVYLIPELTDIVNSGQTQRKYKSGATKRKLRAEQGKRDEQIKKTMPCLLTWVWDKLDL